MWGMEKKKAYACLVGFTVRDDDDDEGGRGNMKEGEREMGI